MNWRDDSVVKKTDNSSRGFRFSFHNPQGDSQPFVTPGPGNLMISSGLCRYQIFYLLHMSFTDTQADNALKHK